MAQRKGQTGNLNGRPKGVPNKATTQARAAIAEFVEGNASRLNRLLDAIEKDSPKDAFNCFMSVVEYHIPKLARTEHTTPQDQPLHVVHSTTQDFLTGLLTITTTLPKIQSQPEIIDGPPQEH